MTVRDSLAENLAAVFAEDEVLAPDADEVLSVIQARVAERGRWSGRRPALVLSAAAAVVVAATTGVAWTAHDGSGVAAGSAIASSGAVDRPAFRYRTPTRPGDLIPAASRQRAESFTLPMLDEGRFTLADHRREVVVLTWSASWCGPCRTAHSGAGLPTKPGITSITVATRDDRDEARLFFGRRPVALDPLGTSLAQLGGLPDALPLTVLIDRNQLVAAVYAAPVNATVVSTAVSRLAAEPAR